MTISGLPVKPPISTLNQAPTRCCTKPGAWMAFAVIKDEPPNPAEVRLLGAQAEVLAPKHVAHLVQ